MSKQSGILGMDIGGTRFRIGFVTQDEELRYYKEERTEDFFKEGKDIFSVFEELYHFYKKSYQEEIEILALSVGLPSTIDRKRRVILQTPNIPLFPDNFLFVDTLQEKIGIPVFINRDVNNLLLYDVRELNIPEKASVAAIYFGTGVGNAVLLNGRILLGKNGVASELGHLPVLLNNKKCSCGNVGCMETIVSGVALQNLRKEKYPAIAIDDIFLKRANDPAMDEFVKNMGKVIATEENLFDPDYVLIGGGLPMMKGFPKDKLESYAHEFTRKPYPEKNMEIVYPKLDQKKGVLAACLYGRKRLEDASYL